MNPSLVLLVKCSPQSLAVSPARSATASRQIFGHPTLQSFPSRQTNMVSFTKLPLQRRTYFDSRSSQKKVGWVEKFVFRSPITFIVSNVVLLTIAIAMPTKAISDLIATEKEKAEAAEKHKRAMQAIKMPKLDMASRERKIWIDVMGVDDPVFFQKANVDKKR